MDLIVFYNKLNNYNIKHFSQLSNYSSNIIYKTKYLFLNTLINIFRFLRGLENNVLVNKGYYWRRYSLDWLVKDGGQSIIIKNSLQVVNNNKSIY